MFEGIPNKKVDQWEPHHTKHEQAELVRSWHHGLSHDVDKDVTSSSPGHSLVSRATDWKHYSLDPQGFG